ncbi:NAD(P)H-dependent FMN reductase [Andreprevotia sp. IGB-42]|uniref:NADPH-dependent FMN reductase n=1 Tax=Andreprevotia sp. IGB-42 TaxID=2497473 RepID=UPI001356AEF2|nr:NADPH-dependent FMN reductase [Andreprevotia sp. IGB-42]KAF0814469.1 NAD(P)H-dependent FMN reductase [Andreprevotia sp. IGB-42]
MTRILAVCGSLRAGSFNNGVLIAAQAVLPPATTLMRYNALAEVPAFNPDQDTEEVPAAVAHWRTALAAADAILIASPEYAFGVPGALKNALDWVVSSGEFVDKPTAVITASSSGAGGDKASAALVQTLRVMSASVSDDAILLIPQVAIHFGLDGEIKHTDSAASLGAVLATLCNAVHDREKDTV